MIDREEYLNEWCEHKGRIEMIAFIVLVTTQTGGRGLN